MRDYLEAPGDGLNTMAEQQYCRERKPRKQPEVIGKNRQARKGGKWKVLVERMFCI